MRVIIKGCSKQSTPLPDLLDPAEKTFILGINDQRSHTWYEGHDGWCSNHKLMWSQLHGLGHMVEQHGEDYLVWLSGLDCPVLMFRGQLERWPVYVNTQLGMDIPLPEMATPFPAEAAVQLGGREYITNSFSWLLAWAIIGGATHITLTGLAMGKDTLQLWESRNTAAKWLEQGTALSMMGPGKPAPNTQKVINDLKGYGSGDESWLLPNVEYWIGIARGRGIEVTVDPACDHGLFYDKWGGLYGLNAGGNE